MLIDDLYMAARCAMPRHSVTALTKVVGVSRQKYYKWVKWRESGEFPHDDNIVKLAEVAGMPLNQATFAIYAAKAKNPEISKVFEEQVGNFQS